MGLFKEYLAYEEEVQIRHEFVNGEIYERQGGHVYRSIIQRNILMALHSQLKDSPYHMLISGMCIKISDNAYVYPDLSIVYEFGYYADKEKTLLINPIMVVEIASSTYRGYDLNLKSDLYKNVPSVELYLVIDQERVNAQLQVWEEHTWMTYQFDKRDAMIPLDKIDCELPLSEVYEGIEFDD